MLLSTVSVSAHWKSVAVAPEASVYLGESSDRLKDSEETHTLRSIGSRSINFLVNMNSFACGEVGLIPISGALMVWPWIFGSRTSDGRP